jgi:hypothetical protein
MREDVIITRTGRVWLDEDGIIQSMQLGDTEQTLADAEENMNATIQAGGGQLRPLLVDMSRVKSIDRAARVRYSSPTNAGVVSAVALVVGTPLSRMIGNFFLGLNRAPGPMKLFGTRRDAAAWLAARPSPR